MAEEPPQVGMEKSCFSASSATFSPKVERFGRSRKKMMVFKSQLVRVRMVPNLAVVIVVGGVTLLRQRPRQRRSRSVNAGHKKPTMATTMSA